MSALYDPYKEALLTGAANWSTDDVRVILVDVADYTFSAAHDFLDDVLAAARVGVSASLTGKTTTGGVADAADITISSVSGDGTEALVLYVHTGVDATSRLVCYIDDAGVVFTPNGGDAQITWDAAGIFAL